MFTNLSLLTTCWWSLQGTIWFGTKVAILFFMSCLLRIYLQSLVFFLNSWVGSIQYLIYWRRKILWKNSGNHSTMYIRFHVALWVHVFWVLSRKRQVAAVPIYMVENVWVYLRGWVMTAVAPIVSEPVERSVSGDFECGLCIVI